MVGRNDPELSLTVRVANVNDASTLSKLGSDVFWKTYGSTAPESDMTQHVDSYFSEPAVVAEFSRADVSYLMAVEGDSCAGLVKMHDAEAPVPAPSASAIEVQQLYVSIDFQRRGVGHLLMDEVVRSALAREVDGIWLSVWASAPWATAFYTKYGFTSLGKVPFMLGSTEFVDHIMWLPVGD
jgi:ribosomal protein S18 acetylase RimI-like enzyme